MVWDVVCGEERKESRTEEGAALIKVSWYTAGRMVCEGAFVQIRHCSYYLQEQVSAGSSATSFHYIADGARRNIQTDVQDGAHFTPSSCCR